MALASYGQPVHLKLLRELITTTEEGGFSVEPIDWGALAKSRRAADVFMPEHADLACSVQRRLEEVILSLATWLFSVTGERCLTMAGGVALNCVANSRLSAEGPFEQVWVQPAAGDAGTALGGALAVSHQLSGRVEPMASAALGRSFAEAETESLLSHAAVAYERPADLAGAVASLLADDAVVGWFEGRSEFGPRALGHRSLLANPTRPGNVDRLNAIKGREEFRPVAPMVLLERAGEIFRGPLPSPYMLFTHDVAEEWASRIPSALHVDGTARVQTVDKRTEPLVHRLLSEFERLSGVPVLVNTSFNTAGRPMVDTPRDALECFASSPIDALVLEPFLIRRHGLFGAGPSDGARSCLEGPS
jgi:carbamoyltransferase